MVVPGFLPLFALFRLSQDNFSLAVVVSVAHGWVEFIPVTAV
jgi:hypothetical protein